MRKISADWIFPVSSPPAKNGVVIIDDTGKILQLVERENFENPELEIYSGIICPGFINAHCHLELSYMKGRFPEHTGLVSFLLGVMKTRNDEADDVNEAMISAEKEMEEAGIVGVGDISNRTTSFSIKKKSKLRYHTFVESNGVNPVDAANAFQRAKNVFDEAFASEFSASITPHAPYSLSDELFEMIFSFSGNSPAIFSYHNQETEEENKLYRGEVNDFTKVYAELNVPSTDHRRGESSIKAHLKFFPVGNKMLMVHNTATSPDDVEFAMRQQPNLYWCFCPNANLYIENKLTDFQNFLSHGDRICLGTDSLASNHQLSILEEMKTIQKYDPSISMAQLIQWATLNGARFFGWEKELGSFEIGKRPGVNLISGIGDELRLGSSSTIRKLY